MAEPSPDAASELTRRMFPSGPHTAHGVACTITLGTSPWYVWVVECYTDGGASDLVEVHGSEEEAMASADAWRDFAKVLVRRHAVRVTP